MKQILTVNGKSYQVEIGDLTDSPIEVIVNGKKYSVEFDPGESAFSHVVPVASPATEISSPSKPPLKNAPSPATVNSGNDLHAPMPGTILDIAVKPGDKVTIGQTLCFLEAMKMKNALKSPRDAVIASVEVAEGQKVGFGEILIRYV
ncbi:MAG: acetyl-CoA carboxylase biotin carboxyl carrier protein subunit [Anaerolineaceae bacterium]|nr:acetyl-CoA carboxylase biotin carboxyl carrier protein subunit [Anaerolineaceae bacterium]